ncbi:ankyrin repeat and sterile alpha motif domain-containing protein 1B-like isoform X3 [Stylophora pistillata]|uniref:ankyrin repeat and sterile alpha motif domain-containing protein 1B-like isoform X3 n=1 Tax=Stylophora pistillata TaxID=50429 RepID=UPI000C047216|nr:ankyrin repeat and sterile alpha motif domain-containing protein 1B-like isoform X3 [Stylophora pistillata]
MGKEQDLLQAAKTGNVAHIEKILGHKTRKSGIQSLMSRTVNSNHQDELGYTPLHYAALNGHRSSAELLLKYDASTNIPDNSGNFPLHLAAWNGHADVARVLINTGPSRANVNEQNGTEDTALHSASQFGQSLVVAVLLENHADPYIRNSRQESPLDLAAQYGRMEAVKQLLSYHPNLLDDVTVVRTHTPLHLAARNGHMNVVSYFLSCGMDVNTSGASGTALHEAALYGKVDVVNLLLQCGIDVTVVDSSNKTVLDLLVSHPSGRTREIKELIYEYKPGTRNSARTSGTFPGYPERPKSMAVPRRPTYDTVPRQTVVDSNFLRRSGTYDAVPTQRTRQESFKQPSYDTVPPPKAASERHTLNETQYDKVGSRTPNNNNFPPLDEGYYLMGAPEQPSTELPPGYSLVGVPGYPGAVTNGRCPLRPGSTYTEVRKEGETTVSPWKGPPSQIREGNYSYLGFPGSAGEKEPLTVSGMAGKDIPGYCLVGETTRPLAQLQNQSGGTYDHVNLPSRPNPDANQHNSVYEVPFSSLRGKGNGQEANDTPVQVPPRVSRGQSLDVYENTSIGNQPVKQPRQQATNYDFVSLPPRKATMEQPSYDIVPPLSRAPDDQRGSLEVSSSATGGRTPTDRPCPLDAPGYEIVQPRKFGSFAGNSAPEMQPFAALPGYEAMAPPQDEGYEKLAPPPDIPQQLSSRGDYETLAMISPQRTGSQTEPPRVTQQRTSAVNIPGSTSLYEFPPPMTSPVYEIAPSPRNATQLPPRQTQTAPPPQAPVNYGVQWIEKEPEQAQPKVPPRRMNDYCDWQSLKKQNLTSAASPPKSGPYEKVRLEGPSEAGIVDLDKMRWRESRGSGGDYCTLSPSAVRPGETINRDSIASSVSYVSEPTMTPPFSPPSPNTAEASVFEVFGSLQPSDMTTIPEAPGDVQDQPNPPRPIPRKRTKPKLLPRDDSLHDEEYATQLGETTRAESSSASLERSQDPFSFPPAIASAQKMDSPKNSNFAELHKRFSPHSSRENIFSDVNASPGGERQEPDGAESQNDVRPSPLVYENVLFRRSDEVNKTEASDTLENGTVVKRDDSVGRPGSYRLSTLSAESPMDEREEWEKIEAFLSSISQIDVPHTLEQQIADAGKAGTIAGWLKALDLGQYESCLVANGFDNIMFLNGVLEDDDLMVIGIVDFNHRRTIMEAVKTLKPCPRLSDPVSTKPESLEDWLELLSLSEYFVVFQHNDITSMKRIRMLWEVELTSVLEINSLGHRKRIMASLKEEVKNIEREEPSENTELEDSSAALEVQLAELKMYCPDEKPLAITTTVATREGDLLAAAEEMTDGPKKANKRKSKEHGSMRWKHEPSMLLNGSVNYGTLYLGSHAVKTITGLQSTVEASRKIRLSTAKLQKIPSVMLSVSVKGIKFIDARSKIMVSNHDIRNISYITQDPEDKRVFAYIAKDAKTNNHYCHVFRMDTMTLSDEITMTIGQAFELAFSHFK